MSSSERCDRCGDWLPNHWHDGAWVGCAGQLERADRRCASQGCSQPQVDPLLYLCAEHVSVLRRQKVKRRRQGVWV